LLFWRWVLKGEVLFWGTSLFQFWPWHHLVKTSLLAGEWPLWNALLGNGTPLLANLQTAVFYPPNLLYLLLPVEHGLTLSVILHLILAGLFTYFYTRYIGLSPFAATLASLAYMFSGYLVGRTQFVTMINAAAWIPLLLLLAERVAGRRVNNNILWLGLALAMQLLAGHAQLWFYSLWLIGAYLIFRSWQEASQQKKQRWLAVAQGGGRFGLAVGLAILLAAGQLGPTVEFMTQSPRQSGAERTFALTYSFWPWRLVTLLAPDFFGNPAQGNFWGYANYWEDHAYVGVLPFLLALIAIWRFWISDFRFQFLVRFRNSDHHSPIPSLQKANRVQSPPIPNQIVPFFAMLIPISLILAMGWNTPIYLWVFDTVPGFGYFQAPARLLIWYTIAMAILAGVGAQLFELSLHSRRHWRRLLIACLGLTVAGITGRLFLSGKTLTFLTAALTLGTLLTASIIILLTRPSKKSVASPLHPATPTLRWGQTFSKETLWQGLTLIFVAVDLLWVAAPLIRTLPATIFDQPIASANFLKAQSKDERFFVSPQFDRTTKFQQYFRFYTFGPREVDYWQGFRETLVPNLGVYAGLQAANNDDPLVVGHWQQLVNQLKRVKIKQRARLLALMNVGYLIDAAPQNNWPVIYHDEAITIQRVPEGLPRAYFVSQAYQAKTKSDVLARLTSLEFDPRHEVIIMDTEDDLTIKNQDNHLADIQPVAVSEQSPHRISLLVEAPVAGFVVLADTFYPGWQATVDGRPAQIWPANLAFRAVAVESGQHEIVFNYRPRSFTVGLWISIVTLLIVIIIIGIPVKVENLVFRIFSA
jgi:hypothetical protein